MRYDQEKWKLYVCPWSVCCVLSCQANGMVILLHSTSDYIVLMFSHVHDENYFIPSPCTTGRVLGVILVFSFKRISRNCRLCPFFRNYQEAILALFVLENEKSFFLLN